MQLTPLQYAAIHIYQAMIASLEPGGDGCQCEEMADKAIEGAHILINKLEDSESGPQMPKVETNV